ncbi:protein of unknown function [Pseudorhizobium banfieldiae]|uniref:Uncharacterized protein n=1 Tax=Pseudorhizobium banfieldiae TaxID=1125847 RepID=L0NL92_9HYPH|nr:protein of unknown function [Pseudorhizobium banfieldiae]
MSMTIIYMKRDNIAIRIVKLFLLEKYFQNDFETCLVTVCGFPRPHSVLTFRLGRSDYTCHVWPDTLLRQ